MLNLIFYPMKDCKVSTPLGVFVLALIFGLSVFMVSAQEDSFDEEDTKEPPVQQVSKREISDFIREMKDVTRESKDLLKNLKKAKGTDEWQQTISEVVKGASSCASKIQTMPADDKRSFMDDCRGSGFWDNMNEIREEFVPPQEIKNVLNEIKRQLKDLERFRKQLLKSSPSADTKMIDDIIAQINSAKTAIEQSKGKDQRDAMNEYWSNNYWEEVNKVRARVELPKELKNIAKEVKFALKDASSRQVTKAFAFFGLDNALAKSLLTEKGAKIAEIQSFLDQGNYESASDLMQEEIHEGWHPGDLRHFLGMMRESYDRLKNIKDKQILDQILLIMEPIAQSFNEGDVREARDGMVEFTNQMEKYERLFRPYYRGGIRKLDKKTMGALDKLEELIQEKFKKGELKNSEEESERRNGNRDDRASEPVSPPPPPPPTPTASPEPAPSAPESVLEAPEPTLEEPLTNEATLVR